MNIAFVVSECVPYIKTGGLADVAGALPKALSQTGCRVKIFMPLYGSINTYQHDLVFVTELYDQSVLMQNKKVLYHVWYSKLPESDAEIYFIENAYYYHRPFPYTNDNDENERFILLQHASLQIMQFYKWTPDIIHCNDWQSGLIPALIKTVFNSDTVFSNCGTLLSIHNIGYQGRFPRDTVYKAGLNEIYYYPGGPFEFENSFNFLKTGIAFADMINTVSETYAREIQTHIYGSGMNGVLLHRKNDLRGILNGIDSDEWNPANDPYIAEKYSVNSMAKKIQNKKKLLERVDLSFSAEVPVIGIVTRLTHQKGIELLQKCIADVMSLPLQIVALGSGESYLEEFLLWAHTNYPEKFAAYIGYNNELSHLITAGSDMFLMPSLYEPCGLNQMYSLNYGTVPIVRKTGGLADTVKDYHEYYTKGNGFTFNDFTPSALYLTIKRALDLFADKKEWKAIMKRGITEDFSWNASAEKYILLYEEIIRKVRD